MFKSESALQQVGEKTIVSEMKIVYIYPGEGRFTGDSEFEGWASPESGSVHKFMLFIAQGSDMPEYEMAEQEMIKFGFSEFQLGVGKSIDVEALNQPRMQVFQKQYEGAFSEGSSLVWYP